MLGNRAVGLTAFDGIEIAKGLAEIENMRREGTIDSYYARAAENAFIERTGESQQRAGAFEEATPFGAPLAPGALAHMYQGKTGPDVGGSVAESCRCTPREFDAIDNVSGWGIYYIGKGILLTPTKKCIASSGKPLSFFERTWRNVLTLVSPTPKLAPAPGTPGAAPGPGTTQPTPAPPPAPAVTCLCYDPRIWAPRWRPQDGPCEPPKIAYPDQPQCR